MDMKTAVDIVGVASILLISVGAAMVYVPAGLIVLGSFGVAIAYLLGRTCGRGGGG